MKKFIYMNEQIRLPVPQRPVIVCQSGDKVQEGNRVDLLYKGRVIASVIYDPSADPSPTHEVKAFVQTVCETRVK